MKKIVLSIISILSAICLTIGIAGCNSFPMPDEISAATGVIRYNNFDDFKTFYNGKFVKANKGRMYLLDPGENILQYEYSHKFFYIQGESLNDYTFENPVVKEVYDVYDKELGDWYDPMYAGSYRYSFHVEAEFYPVTKKVKSKQLSFKFDNSKEAYITVTITYEEELVGTCEFNTKLDISNEWFEEYIISNLI